MKAKWKTNIKMLDINKYNSTIDWIKIVNGLDIPFKWLRWGLKRGDIIYCHRLYTLSIYILKLNASRGKYPTNKKHKKCGVVK